MELFVEEGMAYIGRQEAYKPWFVFETGWMCYKIGAGPRRG